MNQIKRLFIFGCMVTFLFSCGRKSTPTVTNNNTEVKKAVVAPKVIHPVPKVIAVNDQAATKTVDGRYYYDLNKKRYWRNNRDGKYYLFNKSMYNNNDFKAQGN